MLSVQEFLPERTIALLQKQEYALFGHSAVKVCHYTKTAILDKGTCYKQKFYGIQSHQCIQMSPSSSFCDQKCTYCWRPTQTFKPQFTREDGVLADASMVDAPIEIVPESIKAQNKQLSGFGGNANVNKVKYEQSKTPRHVAISLTGEPTLYPRLPELIDEYHRNGISTFLVSNGLHPEMLEQLIDHPPTQLYLSVDTAKEEIHLKLNKPDFSGTFAKLKASVALLRKIQTRTVIRITVVKGHNDNHEQEFAAFAKTGNPDFVEIKSYMHVGFSQYRLKAENMMSWPELVAYAQRIADHMGYVLKLKDEKALICLLVRPDWVDKSTIINFKALFPEHYAPKPAKAKPKVEEPLSIIN
ncbi:MAG: 4-demethylwyosine synthase TYW1 [Candidatus Diapherotrites archaeon]|nr:4-demethylwyosine synthase TYW1 [Candidatus Diapherotrites archaeon]